ncbi:MAG: hypothetical protein ABWZ76_03810 [Acidimicrobiales bacterium]
MADRSDSTSEDITLERHGIVRSRRPGALWGILAVVAIGAGALAVAAGGGGDDAPPPLPVTLGGAAGRETAAMATDMMLSSITYVAGPGLPPLGGSAPAYELTGTVDDQRVQQLAAVLGVSGERRREGQMWVVVGADGSMLEVFEGGGGTWWYAAEGQSAVSMESSDGEGTAGCEPGPAADCAVDGPSTAECPPDECAILEAPGDDVATTTVPGQAPACPDALRCTDPTVPPLPVDEPEPVPVADLPSETEARQVALEMLAATGMDVDGARITVDGPYEAWYVAVEPLVEGVPVSGGTATVSVGPDGITAASGSLGRPENLGDYPLLDTVAAIGRLNTQQQSLGGDMRIADGSSSSSGTAEATIGWAPVETPATSDTDCDPSGNAVCNRPLEPTTTVTSCDLAAGGSGTCGGSGGTGVGPSVDVCTEIRKDLGAGTDPDVKCVHPPVQTCGDVSQDPADQTEPAPAVPCVEPLPVPEPMPMPEPEATEVELTEAEHTLLPLPASDGSGDVFLVPAYRFTGDSEAMAEVVAVVDESLAPTAAPPTSIPEETDTTLDPPPPAEQSCEVLVEEDSSGSTHAMDPCAGQIDPGESPLAVLAEGEQPAVGLAYYVEGLNTHCGTFVFAGRWWMTDAPTPLDWSTPTEGGAFTLSTADTGQFVGDSARTKVATFTAQGPAEVIPPCG